MANTARHIGQLDSLSHCGAIFSGVNGQSARQKWINKEGQLAPPGLSGDSIVRPVRHFNTLRMGQRFVSDLSVDEPAQSLYNLPQSSALFTVDTIQPAIMSATSALPPKSNPVIGAFCRQLHAAQILEYQFQQEADFIRAFRDTTPDLLLQLRADGTVLNVNHTPEFTLFPVTAEILQRNIDEFLPTEPARILRVAMDDALREQKPAHCEWTLPIDGQEHQFEVRVAYLRSNQVLAIVRDVTEQHDLLQQMEAVSIRLLVLQEDERGRIAHDLHDEVGQTLTAALLQLEQIAIRTGKAASPECDQLRTTLQELTRYVRNLALELRPAILDDMGLGPALVSMAQRYQVRTHIHVGVFLLRLDRRFTREVETAAYRIIQEALTNVARYAQVKQASVKLKVEDQVLRIEIEDHGVGFEVQRILRENETHGLRSMRERALLLRGTFRIESTLGQGTCVIVELPLGDQAEESRLV